MAKEFNFSASEFFYDDSFDDYAKNQYLVKYTEIFKGRAYEERVEFKSQLFIELDKPSDYTISLTNVIGVFEAYKDQNGVYGSYKIFDTHLSTQYNVRDFCEKGFYKLAPHGITLYDNRAEIIKFQILGVHLKPVKWGSRIF
jgi:hypothetical protein